MKIVRHELHVSNSMWPVSNKLKLNLEIVDICIPYVSFVAFTIGLFYFWGAIFRFGKAAKHINGMDPSPWINSAS